MGNRALFNIPHSQLLIFKYENRPIYLKMRTCAPTCSVHVYQIMHIFTIKNIYSKVNFLTIYGRFIFGFIIVLLNVYKIIHRLK